MQDSTSWEKPAVTLKPSKDNTRSDKYPDGQRFYKVKQAPILEEGFIYQGLKPPFRHPGLGIQPARIAEGDRAALHCKALTVAPSKYLA